MKRRSGFVSNSSSSSFIVGFERRPASVEEVHKVLFKEDLNEDTHVTVYDYTISTKEVAQRVFNDLKEQKKAANTAKILKEIESGWFPGHPTLNYGGDKESRALEDKFRKRFPDLNYYDEEKFPNNKEAVEMAKKIREIQQAEWAEESRIRDEAALDYMNKQVLPIMKGKKVYVFSYADDGGEAALEHGNIFSNLPHVQISHH